MTDEYPKNPGHHLKRIEIREHKFWLQYFNRTLYTLNFSNGEFKQVVPPFISPLDDYFLLPDGRVLVAMEKGDIWVNSYGNWEFLTDIPFAGINHIRTRTPPPRVNKPGFGSIPGQERTYRLFIEGDEILVLSPFNLYRFSLDSGMWDIIPLGEWLPDAVQISIVVVPDGSLYIGFNRGEIPGGLKKINPRTGQLTTIDGRQPVTGMVTDPVETGVVILSAGCRHRSMDFGGIYRVRGEHIESLYRDSAVFDLKSSGESIIGAGNGTFHRYDADGIQSASAGEYQEFRGLKVTDVSKRAFLVCSDINMIVLGSGRTPLLGVRDI
jgi:hypothetical protein